MFIKVFWEVVISEKLKNLITRVFLPIFHHQELTKRTTHSAPRGFILSIMGYMSGRHPSRAHWTAAWKIRHWTGLDCWETKLKEEKSFFFQLLNLQNKAFTVYRFFTHVRFPLLRLIKNKTQTAVINILNLHIFKNWRFVCTLHTFSKVTVDIIKQLFI